MEMDNDSMKIQWQMFHVDVRKSIEDCFTENLFTDVTLVSDDEYIVKAHRIIISMCSPKLKRLLENNSDFKTLLYLKDIKFKELTSILQFIYSGEVSIEKEDIVFDLKTE